MAVISGRCCNPRSEGVSGMTHLYQVFIAIFRTVFQDCIYESILGSPGIADAGCQKHASCPNLSGISFD